MYNRKSRREIAKKLGLSKKETLRKNPEMTYEDVCRRSMEAGKQIELANKEMALNAQIKADAEKEGKIIENLMKPIIDKYGKIIKEGLTYDQAINLVKENKRIQDEKNEKRNKKNKN